MLPGVAAVGAASHVPLVDRNVPFSGFIPEGTDPAGRPPNGSVRFVDADYIAAMGIPVHRGRPFNTSESHDLLGHVIIINDTMARRYWPDRDPVGNRLRLVGTPDIEGSYEVIGVVGNVAQRNLPADPENQMYLPLASASDLTLVVRAPSDPVSLAGSARDAVRAVDGSVAVTAKTMTMAFRWYVMAGSSNAGDGPGHHHIPAKRHSHGLRRHRDGGPTARTASRALPASDTGSDGARTTSVRNRWLTQRQVHLVFRIGGQISFEPRCRRPQSPRMTLRYPACRQGAGGCRAGIAIRPVACRAMVSLISDDVAEEGE